MESSELWLLLLSLFLCPCLGSSSHLFLPLGMEISEVDISLNILLVRQAEVNSFAKLVDLVHLYAITLRSHFCISLDIGCNLGVQIFTIFIGRIYQIKLESILFIDINCEEKIVGNRCR